MTIYCPGSQKFKQPQPENIRCQNCQEEVEIWTDEVETVCPKCKKRVARSLGQNCLDWCKYAKECIGEDRYNDYSRKRNSA